MYLMGQITRGRMVPFACGLLHKENPSTKILDVLLLLLLGKPFRPSLFGLQNVIYVKLWIIPPQPPSLNNIETKSNLNWSQAISELSQGNVLQLPDSPKQKIKCFTQKFLSTLHCPWTSASKSILPFASSLLCRFWTVIRQFWCVKNSAEV